MISRRGFLSGLASAIAAPAIIKAANIMPARALIVPQPPVFGASTIAELQAIQAEVNALTSEYIRCAIETMRRQSMQPIYLGGAHYVAIVPPEYVYARSEIIQPSRRLLRPRVAKHDGAVPLGRDLSI